MSDLQKYQAEPSRTKSFLLNLLQQNATPEAMEWLQKKLAQLEVSTADKDLYLAFSSVPRYMGKAPLDLTPEQAAEAQTLRKGLTLANWTVDQTARTLLLLALPHDKKDAFVTRIETLFTSADMRELVALYAALPLLPYPDAFKKRAAEGFRSNMGNVFEAVALDTPYPADYLEEEAWNHMVLKTLFVAKPLYRIQGIDKRANAKLAHILSDYAHERWAAGRPVSPELWRPMGPFIDDALLPDIKRLFAQPDPLQQQAAALACSQSTHSGAKALLDEHPQLKERITSGELTWDQIGNELLALQS
ncbi:EboA domain-containing protein [Pontibacter liquoris]|uniref:EboA domain-containing protein n=1 Tax=Pontibacter liquoris TaxID=2905677 RepID=UPI001FA7F6EF|nr:EboA domain-containing protein [Pontibacter liquoris]